MKSKRSLLAQIDASEVTLQQRPREKVHSAMEEFAQMVCWGKFFCYLHYHTRVSLLVLILWKTNFHYITRLNQNFVHTKCSIHMAAVETEIFGLSEGSRCYLLVFQ